MKTELAALELHYLIKEFQALVGARVDKIYQPEGLLFQIHKTGLGKVILRIESKVMWLTSQKSEAPDKIAGLCQLLRKTLEGKKLVSVEQVNGERIARLTFSTQTDTFILYIELFANGNVILCDERGIVKMAHEERSWKDRTIKRGLAYQLPPSKANILSLTRADFDLELEDEPLSKKIAQMGFGKLYALELCARAKVDLAFTTLSAQERDMLFLAYQKMLSDETGAQFYLDGEMTPFKLQSRTEESKPYTTFSLAIDDNLGKTADMQKLDRKKQKYLAEKERIEKLIAMQEEGLKAVEINSAQLQRMGELIYEHYQELKELLAELNKAKAKHSLQEIKARLKGHPKIKDLNPETSDLIVEIGN